jgi:S1-C subfamily serine protease
MPAKSELAPLTNLSASLSGLVAATAPSIVAIHSHRALSSGFIWKTGMIVTADEALADEGEVAVTLAGGKRISATIAGRDPTTDIALLRADIGAVLPIALDGSAPTAGALAVVVGGREGEAVAALGVVATSGVAWQSMRGGEIDARIELDLSLRRHAEGGLALDASGQAFGMAVFGPRRRVPRCLFARRRRRSDRNQLGSCVVFTAPGSSLAVARQYPKNWRKRHVKESC